MKRFLTAALAALLLLSLASCGGTPADDVPEMPDADTQPQEQDTPPEPTPEELAAQEVEDLLASMTLEEKVGQLFFVRVPDAEAVSDVSTYHSLSRSPPGRYKRNRGSSLPCRSPGRQ